MNDTKTKGPEFCVSPLVPITAIAISLLVTLIFYAVAVTHKKHDAGAITLDKLTANATWILQNKEIIEKEGQGDYYKCLMNKAITHYNTERDEFLHSSFEARELVPQEIEKFDVKCGEEP